MDRKTVVFEQEYFPEDELIYEELSVYCRTGRRYVYSRRLSKSKKCLDIQILILKRICFLQKFLKESRILDELEAKGIQEGDTGEMYGLQFDYYK